MYVIIPKHMSSVYHISYPILESNLNIRIFETFVAFVELITYSWMPITWITKHKVLILVCVYVCMLYCRYF